MHAKHSFLSRRDFLRLNAACASGVILYGAVPALAKEDIVDLKGEILKSSIIGELKSDSRRAPIVGSQWYSTDQVGDGLKFTVKPGSLTAESYLIADMLLDGKDLTTFTVTLREGETGQTFTVRFGLLAQCSARMRIPLSLVDMNRWRLDREGAWLKPICGGQRVNPATVDCITFTVTRKSDDTVRWCMTPLIVSDNSVPKLDELILPKGKLLDIMGQSTIHSWAGKSSGPAEVTKRIYTQSLDAPKQRWPRHFSKWGGWKDKMFSATGYFRTEFADNRWWLVDPDGHAFWSAGCDCVRSVIDAQVDELLPALAYVPKKEGVFASVYTREGTSINYLGVNFIRAFGEKYWKEKWSRIALAELRRIGFNTVGNWSEWEYAKREAFPYVRPMSFRPVRIKQIYRDFPDVYDTNFKKDAADYASQLSDTADDPALIGYFMMNEPTWGFSKELPALGMLLNTPVSHTRKALSDFLKQRYRNNSAFSAAWKTAAKLKDVAGGEWNWSFNGQAMKDLQDFSEVMVVRFFETLRNACKKVDANHMNLGIRYAGVPPKWAIKGMETFDVFSMNRYAEKIPADTVKEIHDTLKMPTMIGEYHFGALDAGMPASGIGHVKSQADRGKAYRVYLEDAAANPYCVGVHWFTLYDQSALGRFDGENYNIGFLDVCNRPYKPLCRAARLSHEVFYKVAAGQQKAYNNAPEYLPKLYL